MYGRRTAAEGEAENVRSKLFGSFTCSYRNHGVIGRSFEATATPSDVGKGAIDSQREQ